MRGGPDSERTSGAEPIQFTIDLRQGTGVPGRLGLVQLGRQRSNLLAFPNCTSLPLLRAYAPGWAGRGHNVYFAVENRSGQTGLICT